MPKKPVPHKLEMPVVGLNHRMTASTRRLLESSVQKGPISLTLQREPDNLRDENAIKVILSEAPYKGMHIGYLPRTTAALLAPAWDSNQISDLGGMLTDVDVHNGEAVMLLQFKGAVKMKVQS